MQNIDKGLLSTIDKISEEQIRTSNQLLLHKDDPKSFEEIGLVSQEIFKKSTDDTLLPEITGSWIAGQFMPFQLLTQKKLFVDLSTKELMREKPLGLPITSIIKLLKHNLIYINLRDYKPEHVDRGLFDSADIPHNKKEIIIDNINRNLDFLLEKCQRKIFIGSAIRKPIFDFLNLKEKGFSSPYEKYQEYFVSHLKKSAEAFKSFEENDNKPNTNVPYHFRGENISLIASSWHYAYLSSMRTKLPDDVFNTTNETLGIDDLIKKCIISGEVHSNNKNVNNRDSAARDFVLLANKLRTAHLNNTAPITGAWGCTYNQCEDDFINMKAMELSFNNPIYQNSSNMEPTKTNNFNKLLVNILQQEGRIASRYAIKDLIFRMNSKIDDHLASENLVDSIIEYIECNSHEHHELQKIYNELLKGYQKDHLSDSEVRKMIKQYNSLITVFGSKFNKKLNMNVSVGTRLTVGPFFLTYSKQINKLHKPFFIRNPKHRFLVSVKSLMNK